MRVLAATHVDVERALESGRFREDLFYRLDVITIQVPPLRERIEDLAVLANHFLRVHAQRNNKRVEHIAPVVLERFATYRWPGNVRELENVIERGVVLARGDTIDLPLLPAHISERGGARSDVAPARVSQLAFKPAKALAVQSFEQRYVREVMARSEGNVSAAARIADLDRSNFRRLLKRYPGVIDRGPSE